MLPHEFAKDLVQGHPLLGDLMPYLAEKHISKATREFLEKRTFFAYPRTLWIKLAVNSSESTALEHMSYRHSLNPKKTGAALTSWLAAQPSINNLVFDLSGVMIFDAEAMRELFQATAAEQGGGKYYVCPDDLKPSLLELGVEEAVIRSSKEAMLDYLRDNTGLKKCVVKLPAITNLLALDEALRQQAPSEKLQDCDVITFDMSQVLEFAFEAHAMLTPVIHSLAHSHGILASVVKARDKIGKEFALHGTLQSISANMVETQQLYLRRAKPAAENGIFPLHTFSEKKVAELRACCRQRLEDMIESYHHWFINVGMSSMAKGRFTTGGLAEERLIYIKVLLVRILDELVDNVVAHARGLGYVMIELNPESGKGLRIYVGDTGVGLAKGLERSYKMKKPSDVKAAAMAMSLNEELGRRRRLPGTLKYGGRGLSHVGMLLRRLGGSIRLRTGTGMAEFAPATIREAGKTYDDLYFVQGTHFSIYIPSRWKERP